MASQAHKVVALYKSAMEHPSGEVQKFVSDPERRKQTLTKAAESIKASPKTYAKRLVETAKHEVHEFKEAGEGLKSVIKGGNMTPKQKKAIMTVAIPMCIAIAAAALTSTGVFAGAAALGKGVTQKIALKAAARSLENIHMIQELSHIGHGAHALMDVLAAEGIDPEEALAILVQRSVLKELEEFSDEDMAMSLEEASENTKVAYVLAKIDQLIPSFEAVLGILDDLPISEFDRILLASRTESSTLDNRVWQKRFIPYIDKVYAKLQELEDPKEIMEDVSVGYSTQTLTVLIWQAQTALQVPRKASPDYAISDIQFQPSDETGRDEISYSVPVLKEWVKELEAWSKKSKGTIRALIPKVRRVIKVKGLV